LFTKYRSDITFIVGGDGVLVVEHDGIILFIGSLDDNNYSTWE
jgi:hypothetical protein